MEESKKIKKVDEELFGGEKGMGRTIEIVVVSCELWERMIMLEKWGWVGNWQFQKLNSF